MKKIRFLTSLILLLTLVLTLGGETFGKSIRSTACGSLTSSTQSSHEENHQKGCDDQDQSGHANHCSDPCHMGLSHFGHCSYIGTESNVHFAILSLLETTHSFSKEVFEGPVLEGLRRPPRYA